MRLFRPSALVAAAVVSVTAPALAQPSVPSAAVSVPRADPFDIAAQGAAFHEAFARFQAHEAATRLEDAARRDMARRDAAARVAVAETARSEAARAASVAAHLFVPAGAEALVRRQAVVVRRRFAAVEARTRRTFPMIERALRRRGLPDDLKYVALIESALDPAAVSPAGAAGLWQFMPATAADYGLDAAGVRDPARSTDAAVRYLAVLGRAFDGDWQLALAAYNCGWGRVRRLADAHRRRTGETATFWDLHDALPAETRDYVPRFIAAAAHFGSTARRPA